MTAYEAPTIEHSDWDATEERAPLFTVSKRNPDFDETRPEDDDNPREIATTYTMPNKPHVGLGLAFLRMARIHGGEIAMTWLIEEAIGTEGFFALVSEPDIDQAVITGIYRRIREIVLGGLEAGKG